MAGLEDNGQNVGDAVCDVSEEDDRDDRGAEGRGNGGKVGESRAFKAPLTVHDMLTMDGLEAHCELDSSVVLLAGSSEFVIHILVRKR